MTTFEKLTVNIPFFFKGDDRVMVKIDDSRFIVLGRSGAHTVDFRE